MAKAKTIKEVQKKHTLSSNFQDSVKKRFNNEPHRFLNFVQDESNYDELTKMGLINTPPDDKASLDAATTVAEVEEIPRDEPASDEADRVVT